MEALRINVRGQPNQYVELRSSTGLVKRWDTGPGPKQHTLTLTKYDEVVVAHGEVTYRLRCDAQVSAEIPVPDHFSGIALFKGVFKKREDYWLDAEGYFEFVLHMSTPLAPKDQGVWVRLGLEIDNGTLGFKRRRCGLRVATYEAEQENYAPPWRQNPEGPWTLKKLPQPALDNTLLSCAPGSAREPAGNLIDVEPQRKSGTDAPARLSLCLGPPDQHGIRDICTELELSAHFTGRAPVSGYPLLLHSESRASAPYVAGDVLLHCTQQGDRRGWTLLWKEIPGSQENADADALTLESLSGALLQQHALGLATTRARNRLSLVPTWMRTVDDKDTVALQFELDADEHQKLRRTRLRALQVTGRSCEIQLHCAGALDLEGKTFVLPVKAVEVAPREARNSVTLLSWRLEPLGTGNTTELGIGSVQLSIKVFAHGFLQLGVASDGTSYRRATLVSKLELTFAAAKYTALSMDPELGFETLSAETGRDRPWTLDLTGPQDCLLEIVETASQDQSRWLHMKLTLAQAGTRTTDVVLIDPSPLTVVRLNAAERQDGGEILAEYIDDADQAPEWRFYSRQGKMDAILPPQGIGEEMVKGTLHLMRGENRVRVPADEDLFDFRLTPVARLTLDRTDVDMARSEAAWSLRRLLGRRLGAVGVALDRADFELLYGMSARVESKGLRVAELDGFIGRVPYPEELRRARRTEPASVKGVQAIQASEWIAGLWKRPSWWRVYAAVAQRGRLVIDNGVEYRLRPSRQTADPFDIGNYATPEGKVAGREPLRGGVDWPFQSRNIYQELQPKKPTVSSAGSIEGLVFGSLGGEGAQTAAFNNGKTLIITNSRQGRIDSLTLIRVGRIAMLWNKARHVIVYERTTRRSPRYEDYRDADDTADDLEMQPEFKGLAALRKVREYIEITEPRRSYPDTRSDPASKSPLTRSVFATTVVPVRSDWGRDICDGFVIGLRGPVPPGREDFFPDPQVFLDFARAKDKGEGHIGQRTTNTQNLVFFTSTRAEDGGDTDAWPAWPDVDFPLVRPAVPPPLPFSSSFRGSKQQPDAAPVELGMARFTFTVEPAQEAANLMHDRPVKGLETRIFNINLARGLPPAEPPTDPVQRKALDASIALGVSQAVLLDGLAELRHELRERLESGQRFNLSDEPQLQADVRRLVKNLAGTVVGTDFSAAPIGLSWAVQQKKRLDAYTQGVDREVTRLRDQVMQQSLHLEQLGEDLGSARASASSILDAVCKQAQQRLGEIGFVPQHAVAAVRSSLDESVRRLGGQLSAVQAGALQLLGDVERRYQLDPDAAVTLDLLWRNEIDGLPAKLRLFVDTLRKVLDGDLSTWFSRLPVTTTAATATTTAVTEPTIYEQAEGHAAAAIDETADWLARWADTVAPFDLEAPDFDALRDALRRTLSADFITEALAGLEGWLKTSLSQLAGWDQELQDKLKALREWEIGLAKSIAEATDLAALQTALADCVAGLETELGKAALAVRSALEAQLGQLPFLNTQGALDALQGLKGTTEAALAEIEKQLQGDLTALERAVREQADLIEKHAQAAARQVEDWVSESVGSAYKIAKENIDSGLETLRVLAEGPVTDAMRATRDQIGYYLYNSGAGVLLTRASAVFNELSGDVLNALNVDMPFDRFTDRIKACVGGMLAKDLFPSIAGIDMTYLLPDLNVPLEGDNQFEWLRLQHGFDKDRLRAWAKVSINKRFDSDATLFDLGPVKLRLLRPLFAGESDIIIEKDGQRTQRTSALLNADFELSLNDKPMVTLRDGSLSFNESGKLDFQIDADKVEMARELKFITDAVKALMPEIDGMTLTPLLPGGVSCSLCMPLPDIGTGAFTMTGITLNTHLDLQIADGFEIGTGLWLSKPDRPFGLAVLFLGGGGWFGIDATYRPPARFQTRVSIGISAGAFIAVNFGFARGSAGILFTAAVDFYRDWQTGSGTTAISLGILVWGEFSVLGIASASMRLVLRVTYDDSGGMVGTGQFSVSIRICWCYTLRVSRQAQKQFAKGGGQQRKALVQPMATTTSAMLSAADAPAPEALAALRGLDEARSYASLAGRADPATAVDEFLDTLAIVPPLP